MLSQRQCNPAYIAERRWRTQLSVLFASMTTETGRLLRRRCSTGGLQRTSKGGPSPTMETSALPGWAIQACTALTGPASAGGRTTSKLASIALQARAPGTKSSPLPTHAPLPPGISAGAAIQLQCDLSVCDAGTPLAPLHQSAGKSQAPAAISSSGSPSPSSSASTAAHISSTAAATAAQL